MSINLHKVVTLGQSSVGKTSLVLRITKNRFDMFNPSTIGAGYSVLHVKDLSIGLWDTAGQERYLSLVETYYRGAHVVLLVYDISDISSVDRLKYYLTNYNLGTDDGKKQTLIVVGNKTDRVRQEDVESTKQKVVGMLSDYITVQDVVYTTTSAKNGSNTDNLKKIIYEVCANAPLKQKSVVVDDSFFNTFKCC